MTFGMKFLAVAALLWCATGAANALNDNLVEIGELKAVYSEGETVKFSVKNNTDEVLRFYVTPVRRFESEWREVTETIYTETSLDQSGKGRVKLTRLKHGETALVSWYPWTQRVHKKLGFGTYRLKVEVYDKKTFRHIGKTLSASFELRLKP